MYPLLSCAVNRADHPRCLSYVVLALLMSLTSLTSGCQRIRTPPPANQPIHGYVLATVNSDIAGEAGGLRNGIAVPDIEVVAKNVATGVTSAPSKTDPYGYFQTAALDPGSYQICVAGDGFVSACDPATVTVGAYVQVLDHFVFIRTKSSAVLGSVKLADKTSPCFWYAPAFDANFIMTTTAALTDSSGNVVAGPVRGNSQGEYLLPVSSGPGKYSVEVQCEAAKESAVLTLTGPSIKQDFVLNNEKPAARFLEAASAGIGVRRASPGDGLKITAPAIDPDGNALHYRWVDDSGQSSGFPDAQTISWSAPASPGPQVLRVQVSDGRGGYSVSRTVLNVGPNELRFSGMAFNRVTGLAVPAASVELNSVSTTTDANGRFVVTVPDADRFVLNVRKPGFALASQIFYTRAVDVDVPLDPTLSKPVDNAVGGSISLPVTGCIPKDNKAEPAPTLHRAKQRCEKQTIGTLELTFPPDALAANGSPFVGTATVEGFQYDLTLPNPIPGDQSAVYNGADTRLETFGAVYVQPRDAALNPLQMASGKQVEVSMPIHPLALGSAPATIPFFLYDEATGVWVDHGKLKRIGNTYKGAITHFSSFNADTTFGASSCLKVQLDGAFPSAVLLNATYDNPAVGNFNHPNTPITDAHNLIAIERMVPNQGFKLEIRDNTPAHNLLQIASLNSGPATSVPFPVPYPYTNCNGPVNIGFSAVPVSPVPYLLKGFTGDTSANYKTQTTTGFYAGRATLAGWKSANGFPATGNAADEVNAVFFNNGDLKFGRNMHCRVTGTTSAGEAIACYVSNFGEVGVDFAAQSYNPLTNPTNGAYANTHPQATVAMEYHPNQMQRVQFWAFKGDGTYLPNPTLDSQGPKPMPNICIGCHQGSYGGTGLVSGSIFLPFDVDLFLGDDGQSLANTLGVGALRPTQEAFRKLNRWAQITSNVGSGMNTSVKRLTDLWYKDAAHAGGVNDAGATFHFNQGAAQLGTFPSKPALYDDVVRTTCRTCHIARTPGSDTWDEQSQMTDLVSWIKNYACRTSPALSSNLMMPHAEVPYKLFWRQSVSVKLGTELFTPPVCSP